MRMEHLVHYATAVVDVNVNLPYYNKAIIRKSRTMLTVTRRAKSVAYRDATASLRSARHSAAVLALLCMSPLRFAVSMIEWLPPDFMREASRH